MTTIVREFLGNRSKASLIGLASVLIAGIGVLDYLTGYDLSLGLFYIAPISILSWYISLRVGLASSLLSAAVWYWVNSAYTPPQVGDAVLLWNTAIRFGFFVTISYLLSSLKDSHEHQKELARTDPLTGLLNSRAFTDEARIELSRARRNKYRVVLLYLDLDNFKGLNDSKGHAAGDSLLRDIGKALTRHLRSTDIVGRLGGDEFAVLLSSPSETEAAAAASRSQSAVLGVSASHASPVTVTIGAVASDGTEDIESIISRADHAMYQGKTAARGGIYLGPSHGDA